MNLPGISAQADGLTAHGYLYLVLILCLAILAYLCLAILAYLGLRAGSDELPARLPLGYGQRLLAAAGLSAVLVLLAFLIRPEGTGWVHRDARGDRRGISARLVSAAFRGRRGDAPGRPRLKREAVRRRAPFHLRGLPGRRRPVSAGQRTARERDGRGGARRPHT